MESIFRNPLPTTDVIVEVGDLIVLIERANSPFGWALPGGFVEYGESFEASAVREVFEETCLIVKLKEQFHTYSSPIRDPRQHIVTTVFIATSSGGRLEASDDARKVSMFSRNNLPHPVVFDHGQILSDYFNYIDGMDKGKIFKKYLQA